MLIANCLGNYALIGKHSLTLYKADTRHKTLPGHHCQIRQIDLSQSRKPDTSWRHEQDQAKRCKYIRYKKYHIYTIMDSKGKIKRYFRIA